MKSQLIFAGKKSNKCLLVVDGQGDTVKVFAPLITEFKLKLPSYTICSFDFTFTSKRGNILAFQTEELASVVEQLQADYSFDQIDIFCTSMGAYSTVKLLTNANLAHNLHRVIMYARLTTMLTHKQTTLGQVPMITHPKNASSAMS